MNPFDLNDEEFEILTHCKTCTTQNNGWSDEDKCDPKKYPCPDCMGRGSVRDYKDHDCVEGFKGAPWYTCTRCLGTKIVEFQEYYERIVKPIIIQNEKDEKNKTLISAVLEKLTPDDIELLKKHGIITHD